RGTPALPGSAGSSNAGPGTWRETARRAGPTAAVAARGARHRRRAPLSRGAEAAMPWRHSAIDPNLDTAVQNEDRAYAAMQAAHRALEDSDPDKLSADDLKALSRAFDDA